MTNLYKMPEHNAYPRERKRAIKAFFRAYLSLFVFLVFISVAVVAIQYGVLWLFGRDKGYTILSSHYFAYAVQILVVYILGFPLFWVLNLGVPKNYIEEKRMSFGQFLLYFMIAMFVMNAGAYIATFITGFLEIFIGSGEGAGGSVDSFVGGAPIWLTLLVVVIIKFHNYLSLSAQPPIRTVIPADSAAFLSCSIFSFDGDGTSPIRYSLPSPMYLSYPSL